MKLSKTFAGDGVDEVFLISIQVYFSILYRI